MGGRQRMGTPARRIPWAVAVLARPGRRRLRLPRVGPAGIQSQSRPLSKARSAAGPVPVAERPKLKTKCPTAAHLTPCRGPDRGQGAVQGRHGAARAGRGAWGWSPVQRNCGTAPTLQALTPATRPAPSARRAVA